MMRPALACRISVIYAVALMTAGCDDFGYVELKAVPASGRGPILYLDGERVQPPRDGVAVLRQAVGTRRLQTDPNLGEPLALCDIVVRKDRITTVTVSMLERPPRCVCARSSGRDPEAQRICIG